MVYKSKRLLLCYAGNRFVRSYRIALGKNPVGPKRWEGDFKTPEGKYHITDKNPNSRFYKNLGISYPNEEDIQRAQALGKNPGGAIKIHGIRNGQGWKGRFHRLRDWTAGCIAVSNTEMEFLFTHVMIGAEIEILP